jgi:peptide/nickel transport system permease protein
MISFTLRRLAAGLLILVVVNFLGFAYAHGAQYIQQLQNPFGTRAQPPQILALYGEYTRGLAGLDLGSLPVGAGVPVGQAIGEAAWASVGLLAVAISLSIGLGLGLGLTAVRTEPPRVAAWLAPLAALGLATPSFYIGTLALAASILLVVRGLGRPPLPVSGFGWDAHLILPVLALVLRPTAQIASVTASLLTDEIRRPYVVTARSVGNTWRRIRWRHALRNIVAPVLLTIAGAFRFAVGELVLVEWLFAWPGLGRLLAQVLVSPNLAAPGSLGGGGAFFLNPPLLAALITVLSLAFLIADALASGLARAADPRWQLAETGRRPG